MQSTFFLNEPHKIVRVSIDIEEKYKINRRQKKRLIWLDWDINMGNSATQLS